MRTYRLDSFPGPDWCPPAGELAEGAMRVRFRDLLRDPERQRAMVRAFVVEENLTQDLWLELTPEQGGWLLKPAGGCSHFPTRGLQMALERLRASLP